MNLIVLPFVVIRGILWIITDTFATSSVQMMGFKELKAQLKFDEPDTDPSREVIKEYRRLAREYVNASDWSQLNALIETADQERAKSPSGDWLTSIVIEQIVEDAIKDVKSQIRNGEAVPLGQMSFPAVNRFFEAADNHPDQYALNGLAAAVCLEFGWAARGSDYIAYTSKEAVGGMQQFLEVADAFLGRFDPLESNSPMLASLHYHKLLLTGCLLPELKAAYERRMLLDTNDLHAMRQYGFHLLPRWYGDYDYLQQAAQEAYAATHAELGASAYAAFFIDLLNSDEGALATVDLELFERGLMDIIQRSNDQQTTVNLLLGVLSKAGEGHLGQSKTSRSRQRTLREIFGRIVQSELKVLLVPRWKRNRHDVFYLVGEVFKKRIQAGEVVHVGQMSTDLDGGT